MSGLVRFYSTKTFIFFVDIFRMISAVTHRGLLVQVFGKILIAASFLNINDYLKFFF